MGKIINIKNLNHYCGRFSKRPKKKSPQEKLNWYVYNALMERIPVLVFRAINLEDEDTSWPLSWKNDRNLKIAIELCLNMLKAWQAYRPEKSKNIIKGLKRDLPFIIMRFQKKMEKYKIKRARDILRLKDRESQEILKTIMDAVREVSSYKNEQNPMMSSKILNFFFPEIFPVWDTLRIKDMARKEENLNGISLADWLPARVLSNFKKTKGALEYGRYFVLMLEELKITPNKEYNYLKKIFSQEAKIELEIIDFFYYDISPYLFEFCLLGKHL